MLNCFRLRRCLALMLLCALASLTSQLQAQSKSGAPATGTQPPGDSTQNPGPLASDLSPRLKQADVRHAMHKVADWQLARLTGTPSRDWTFAALYVGLLAASDTLGDARYRDYVVSVGRHYDWQLGPRKAHADDQAIGQSYLWLYSRFHDKQMLAPTEAQFESLRTTPDDPAKPVWWWCDALFMAPPVWSALSKITQDQGYLDYMNREWWITSKLLYDPQAHLFSRDATYLDKREQNGQKIFWSRGNGWVMGGLARVLSTMPDSYPERSRYIAQYREMAKEVAAIQSSDGLWRPGLLDADSYPLPEVSGSAFFVYSLAWGVNHGVLDRSTYLPVIQKGWAGILSHVYADGRLGCIQPVGAAPGAFTPSSSYVYGVGAFLLAGGELDKLASGKAQLRK
jgi:unsaturated rhamnogalacturonyl hydrolase